MSWEFPSGPAIDRGDSTAVLYAWVRKLKLEKIDLMAEIRSARLDSVALERHHKLDIDDLNRRLEWAKGQAHSWLQIGTAILITAVISIYATLQAVRISI